MGRREARATGKPSVSQLTPVSCVITAPSAFGPVTLEPQPPTIPLRQPVRLRRTLATPKNPSTASTHCHQGSRLKQPSHLPNIQNFH
ncbi:hypothetical protein PGTUg99_016670 [Puccinia graminis f. sp. tritici]|uniref:Uncharacterized protein n=1 Tax=Puccinia graminis f. sp. tritici TaxID=56615 RepID=A0A5B0MYY5_PUCGR|nr:hypothetical protein PGTUg99_016670 [Puccinia graminis f. sp. tritici]